MKKEIRNKPLYITSIILFIIGGLIWLIHIYIGTFILFIALMLFIASKGTNNTHPAMRSSVPAPSVSLHSAEQVTPSKESKSAHQSVCFPISLDEHYVLFYKYDSVSLAMSSIANFEVGSPLTLEQEPDNPYDPSAVKVLYKDEKIGYLFRGRLQDMTNDFFKKELPVEARIDFISSDNFTCSIGFYKDLFSFESFSASLIKTSKKDFFGTSRQENLSSVYEGNILSIEYSLESESYIVRNDFWEEIGELSSSVSSRLYNDDDDYTYYGVCTYNEPDDNLKYKCKIDVYKVPKKF